MGRVVGIDPVARSGFGAHADRYERARPTYPPDALALLARELGIGPGRRVLDLAAGTGKLTRLLAGLGAEVVAVEPLAAMRAELVARVPAVPAVAGVAEALPLAGGAVDAVTVAQAFHWFDAPVALAEVARVLRPGGGLAMLWNDEDESVPWVAELNQVMHEGMILPFDPDQVWAPVVAASGRFGPLRTASVAFDQELDADLLCERVASASYVASLPEAERAERLARVRALVAGFPPTFVLPYVCTVHWCHRSSA